MDKLKRYPLYELIGKDVHKIQDRDAYIVYASKFGIVFVLEDVSVEIQDIFPLGRLSQIANKRDAQPFI